MVSFELSILDWIQTSLRSGFGDVFFPIITTFADEGIGWVLLCGIPWSSNSSKNTRATLVTVLTELSAQLLCVVTCALNLSRIALC